MVAMCSWNKTWEVGKMDWNCFKEHCDAPHADKIKIFSSEDWCPGGKTIRVGNETQTWSDTHFMDETERKEVERKCFWSESGTGYALDEVECYATHCDNPNTTVNELYNFNLQWSLEANSPMTVVETTIRYPCKDGTKLVDRNLWWKIHAKDYDDIYCGLNGEYQYRDPWFICYPGRHFKILALHKHI